MSIFKNKNVLITGGASGIGKIMGRLALEKGALNLIVWDINEANMETTKNEFGKRYPNIHFLKVDVSNPEEIANAAEETRKVASPVQIIINNAGIVAGDYFHSQNTNSIRKTMEINAIAPMYVAHEFLKCMIEHNEGHICNIASAAGMLGNPQMAAYAASKWAVIGWSESLRLEMQQLKSKVKVTTVTPFYISTGMFDGVKSPIIGIIKPEKAAQRIIRGIERNHIFVRMPAIVYILPFVKGILPVRAFDFVVGKLFGIYKGMSSFKGHG